MAPRFSVDAEVPSHLHRIDDGTAEASSGGQLLTAYYGFALLQGDNLVDLDGVLHPAIGACARPRSFRGRLRAGVIVAAVAKDPHNCSSNSLHPFSSSLLHGFRGIQVEGFC